MTKSRGRVEAGEGGGFGWSGVEGWGENADNCNWIKIKIKKKRIVDQKIKKYQENCLRTATFIQLNFSQSLYLLIIRRFVWNEIVRQFFRVHNPLPSQIISYLNKGSKKTILVSIYWFSSWQASWTLTFLVSTVLCHPWCSAVF